MPCIQKLQKDRDFEREALPWLPHVARYALSLTSKDDDADDLVQETYLRAYRSWTQYTVGTECRAWLFRICRNVFLRTRKRESRQVHYASMRTSARSGRMYWLRSVPTVSVPLR